MLRPCCDLQRDGTRSDNGQPADAAEALLSSHPIASFHHRFRAAVDGGVMAVAVTWHHRHNTRQALFLKPMRGSAWRQSQVAAQPSFPQGEFR